MKTIKTTITTIATSIVLSLSVTMTANAQASYIDIYQPVQGQAIANQIADGIEYRMNTVAPEIRNWVINKGVQFHVMDQASFIAIGGGQSTVTAQTQAFCFVGGTTIFMQTGHARGAAVTDFTMHEVGHLVDDQFGVSTNSEFQRLSGEVAATLRVWITPIDLKVNDYSELWAETFNMYAIDPMRLYNLSPGMYDFCQRVFPTTVSFNTQQPAPEPVQEVAPVVAPKKEMPAGLTKDNFDSKRYADEYADLKNSLGYDHEALWNHYTKHGLQEGRNAYIATTPVVKEDNPVVLGEKKEETVVIVNPTVEDKVVELTPVVEITEEINDSATFEDGTEVKVPANWGAQKKVKKEEYQPVEMSKAKVTVINPSPISEYYDGETGEVKQIMTQEEYIEHMDSLIASFEIPAPTSLWERIVQWFLGLFGII